MAVICVLLSKDLPVGFLNNHLLIKGRQLLSAFCTTAKTLSGNFHVGCVRTQPFLILSLSETDSLSNPVASLRYEQQLFLH